MKTYIQHFVDDYKAILAIKQTHTRRIDIRSFVLEASLIVLLSFGVVPIFGLIGQLNQSFSYLYIASFTMILFTYVITMWLHEVRYQNRNQVQYNIWRYIIPKTMMIVLMVVAAIFLYAILVGILLFLTLFETIFGALFALLGVLLVLLLIYRNLVKRRLAVVSYINSGFLMAILYYVLSMVMNYNYHMIWMYLSHVLIIGILLLRDVINGYALRQAFAPMAYLFTILIAIVFMLFFTQLFYWRSLDDVISTTMPVRGRAVEEGLIVGSYTDDDYIYLKYLNSTTSYMEVYTHDFTHVETSEELPLYFELIELKDELYAITSDRIEGIFTLYKYEDTQFIKQFDAPNDFRTYLPFIYQDEFWVFSILTDKDENDVRFEYPVLYHVVNGEAVEVDPNTAVFTSEDEDTYFDIKNGSIEYYTKNKIDMLYSFYSDYEDQTLVTWLMDDGYVGYDYGTNSRSIYDYEDNLIFDEFGIMQIRDENYYTNLCGFDLDEDYVYEHYCSGIPYHSQEIVATLVYDIEQPEDVELYQSTGSLILLDGTIYEVIDNTVRTASLNTGNTVGTTEALSFVSLIVVASIIVPIHTKEIIVVGGEQDV